MVDIETINKTVLQGQVNRQVHDVVRDLALQGTYVLSGGHVGQRGAGANMSVDVDGLYYYIAGVQQTKGTTTNVIVEAADTLDRIDVLGITNGGTLTITKGTPHAVVPSGQSVWQKFELPCTPDMSTFAGLPMAEIYVPANVTSIVDAYIRMLGCPFIGPAPRASWDTPLTLKEIATPSSPTSGYDDLYFKSDHKLYKKTSGGVETVVEPTTNGTVTGSGTPADGQLVVYDGITGLAIKPGPTIGTSIRASGTASDSVSPTEKAVRDMNDAFRFRNHAWNSSFEFMLGTAACLGWGKLHNDVTVAQDNGLRDGYGGTEAIKITSAGNAKEGVCQTIKSLKASTLYTVRVWMKVTSGNTAKAWTTGASTNLSITSTSTSGEWKTGTFTTDATPTDVVFKLGSDTSGNIVWFDCLSITEGAEIPAAYRKDQEWDSPKQLHWGKGDGSAVVATGALPGFLQAQDNYEIVGWILTSDLSATITMDVWKKTSYPPANGDSLGTTKATIGAGTSAALVPDWSVREITKGDWLGAEIEANDNSKTVDFFLLVRRR